MHSCPPRLFRLAVTALLLFFFCPLLQAQPTPATPPPPSAAPAKSIQDNSFLIEEAYNQEFGVVQHINTFTRMWNSQDWAYTFTQEWPMPGTRHQLSYSLSAVRPGAFRDTSGPGIGDTAINYRLQVLGNGQTRVAFAPRFSVILPTGDSDLGRGYGGTALQTNLPLSTVLTPRLVAHWNAGATIVPHARSGLRDSATAVGYNLGQSMIWLARPTFNLMLETFFNSSQVVEGKDKTDWSRTLLLNPGIRWAYNLKHGLQIVPGIAVPVGVGPSAGEKGIFVYLSFEHPFRHLPED